MFTVTLKHENFVSNFQFLDYSIFYNFGSNKFVLLVKNPKMTNREKEKLEVEKLKNQKIGIKNCKIVKQIIK